MMMALMGTETAQQEAMLQIHAADRPVDWNAEYEASLWRLSVLDQAAERSWEFEAELANQGVEANQWLAWELTAVEQAQGLAWEQRRRRASKERQSSSGDGAQAAGSVAAPTGSEGVPETAATEGDVDPEPSAVPSIRETLAVEMDEWDNDFAVLLDQFSDLVAEVAGPFGFDEDSLAADVIVQPEDGEHRAAAIAVIRRWEGLVERHDHLSDRFDACHRSAMAAETEQLGEGARVRVPVAADRFVTFLERQTKADDASQGFWCPMRDRFVDYNGNTGAVEEADAPVDV